MSYFAPDKMRWEPLEVGHSAGCPGCYLAGSRNVRGTALARLA